MSALMRTRLKYFVVQVLLVLLFMGCTLPGLSTKPPPIGSTDNRWATEAQTLGIPESEIAEVARIAAERYHLVVVWIQKADEGGIAVYLADKPNRAHGIVVVFRKVDGRWEEDPKSKDEWIV